MKHQKFIALNEEVYYIDSKTQKIEKKYCDVSGYYDLDQKIKVKSRRYKINTVDMKRYEVFTINDLKYIINERAKDE